MIEHKPECPASWGVGDMPEGPCTFCEMLRACEQRTLDAARKAVAGVGVRKDTSHDMRVQALAAIDALRGERNG